jgi:transcriptional antiterminator RfaH
MTHPAPTASRAISWILINTHPQKERLAVESLERQQFVGYCPMLLRCIRHPRRSDLVSRPMFPAHVLAGLSAGSPRWQPILSTHGVRTIVRSGKLLNFLPVGFVEALQACEFDGKIVAPSLHGSSGQRGIDPGHGALITAMLGMTEQERLFALIGLLRPAADVSGVAVPSRHRT